MAKRNTAADVAGLVGALVLLVALIMLVPWLVMLLFGVWHSVRPVVPAIGFGEAWLLVVITGLLAAPVRTNKSN
ncbi:hypothetical protein QQY24_15735 [Streptomyces sp. TG1A-8]|uniref:hypothetical protein n=1 Tax=Streptomyces sp. TG1A-8 TaxID=3051385 RepID=UPI00265C5397|nr:hypothetical protein [Streptomyces sp. TG1A-8]MDO0926798.1 hypothetical protein [Streptomyces sp. TG1A-8]